MRNERSASCNHLMHRQGLMALTRARAPARKQGADEALVAEVNMLVTFMLHSNSDGLYR